jgi:hypothetical protein
MSEYSSASRPPALANGDETDDERHPVKITAKEPSNVKDEFSNRRNKKRHSAAQVPIQSEQSIRARVSVNDEVSVGF